MGAPAARIGDNHTCPLTNPAPASTPHVGGPIIPPIPPGKIPPTVFIGGMPAATVGCMCVCAGPPDSILQGSSKVKIYGKDAARMGDPTKHQGGKITGGCATVLIG